MKDDWVLIEQIEKWAFPLYSMSLYLRLRVLEILQTKKES
jgi:hypothetical protein